MAEQATIPSKGHQAFIGNYEYFARDGILHRAWIGYPIGTQGYRQGARFECYAHLTETCLALKRANEATYARYESR